MPFNPDAHEGNDFGLIPSGEYTAIIEGAEMKDTRAGNGAYLSLTFQIVGPTHAGRKIWNNLNLDNPNPKAVAIAENDLADICRATGVTSLPDWPGYLAKNGGCCVYDASPLANKQLIIEVGVEIRKDNGEEQNKIKKYIPAGAKSPKDQQADKAKAAVTDEDLPF